MHRLGQHVLPGRRAGALRRRAGRPGAARRPAPERRRSRPGRPAGQPGRRACRPPPDGPASSPDHAGLCSGDQVEPAPVARGPRRPGSRGHARAAPACPTSLPGPHGGAAATDRPAGDGRPAARTWALHPRAAARAAPGAAPPPGPTARSSGPVHGRRPGADPTPAAAPPRGAPPGARPPRPARPAPRGRAAAAAPTATSNIPNTNGGTASRAAGPAGADGNAASSTSPPQGEQDATPADRRTRAPPRPRERVQRGHAQPAEGQRTTSRTAAEQAVRGQQQPAGEGQTDGRAGRRRPARAARPRSPATSGRESVQTARREGRHDQRPDQHGAGRPMSARGSTTAVRPAATTAASSSTPAARGVGSVPRRVGQPGEPQPGERGAGAGGQRDHHRGRDQVGGTGEEEQRHRRDVAASGAARRGTRTRNGYARSTAVAFVRGHGGGAAVRGIGRCESAAHDRQRSDGQTGYVPVTQGKQ